MIWGGGDGSFLRKKKLHQLLKLKQENFTSLRSEKNKDFAVEGSEEKKFNPTPKSSGEMVFFFKSKTKQNKEKLHTPVRLTTTTTTTKKKHFIHLRSKKKKKKEKIPDPTFHAPPENQMVHPLAIQLFSD